MQIRFENLSDDELPTDPNTLHFVELIGGDFIIQGDSGAEVLKMVNIEPLFCFADFYESLYRLVDVRKVRDFFGSFEGEYRVEIAIASDILSLTSVYEENKLLVPFSEVAETIVSSSESALAVIEEQMPRVASLSVYQEWRLEYQKVAINIRDQIRKLQTAGLI